MARRKLTEEEKQEEVQKRIKEAEEHSIAEMRRRPLIIPNFTFSVGEKVKWGAHPNTEILEVFDNGKFYKVKRWGTYKVYGNPVYQESTDIVDWTHLKKYKTEEEENKIEIFTQEDDIRLHFSQRAIMDLWGKLYSFGLDMSPEYQRGNVWTLEDKVKLIDSIYKNVDIGKFVFVHLPYKENSQSYEVLDGKQRITTIAEFFENRFSYRGKYFQDLHWRDQHHFEGYHISYAEIENATMEQKLKYFLRLNTGGRLVDPAHLEFVESLLKKEVK